MRRSYVQKTLVRGTLGAWEVYLPQTNKIQKRINTHKCYLLYNFPVGWSHCFLSIPQKTNIRLGSTLLKDLKMTTYSICVERMGCFRFLYHRQ